MNAFDDFVDGLSEDDLAEFERVNDGLTAAYTMEAGPDQERVLDALYTDAKAIDSAFHMTAARAAHLMSLFDRGATAEGFRLFVPTIDLINARRHEIPEGYGDIIASIVLQPLAAMIDDANVPRVMADRYLDHLEDETRRVGKGSGDLALARACWYAHTGERDACEEWADRWMTSGSIWWAPEKALTVNLVMEMLGAFDPSAAVEHAEQRVDTVNGRPSHIVSAHVQLAGLLSLCGRTGEAWQRLASVLRKDGLDDIAQAAEVWPLIRAIDGAPLDRSCDGLPGAREIAEAAAGMTMSDTVQDTAALARFHLLRGDEDTGTRLMADAWDLAHAFDARNETDHHRTLLERRWFNDV